VALSERTADKTDVTDVTDVTADDTEAKSAPRSVPLRCVPFRAEVRRRVRSGPVPATRRRGDENLLVEGARGVERRIRVTGEDRRTKRTKWTTRRGTRHAPRATRTIGGTNPTVWSSARAFVRRFVRGPMRSSVRPFIRSGHWAVSGVVCVRSREGGQRVAGARPNERGRTNCWRGRHGGGGDRTTRRRIRAKPSGRKGLGSKRGGAPSVASVTFRAGLGHVSSVAGGRCAVGFVLVRPFDGVGMAERAHCGHLGPLRPLRTVGTTCAQRSSGVAGV